MQKFLRILALVAILLLPTAAKAQSSPCTGETCTLTIAGFDSYGDGWNGNTITVMQGSDTVAVCTIDYGSSQTWTMSVCSGTPVALYWTSGSYAYEASFTVADGGGTVVYTCTSGGDLTDGLITTIASPCPSCFPPTVSVDATTDNSVTISWVSDASSFTVYQGTTAVATGVTASTYTFNGLTANTGYTFGVVASCTSTDSSAMAVVNANTDCPGGACAIQIVGVDSYGDGWNGNAITVYADTAVFATFTIDDGDYNAQRWCFNDNIPISFAWTSGSYPGEASFEIYSNSGALLYSGVGSDMNDGVTFFSMPNACVDSVAPLEYTFTLSCDAVAGSVTGGGFYTEGDTITFTATPNTNYVFVGWTLVALDDNGDTAAVLTASNNPLMFIASPAIFGTYTEFSCTAEFIYQGPVVCSGNSCYLTVEGTDSYGDGWNGGYLSLFQNDTLVGMVTMTSGNSVTTTMEVCDDYPVNFVWSSGNYDSEVSFTITNASGALIASSSDGLKDGAVHSYTNVCSGSGDTTVIGDMVTITVMAADTTMGYTTGSGVYSVDSLFVATAYPYTGYHFLQWQVYDGMGDYLGYASSNPFMYYCDDNYIVVAIFEADPEPIDCSGTSCYLTISGTDSYGDGWNGGDLRLMQNDNLVGIFAVEDSMAVSTFEVCNDYPVNFVWNSGSWDGEVAFTVSSAAGTTILSVASASSLVDGNVFAMVTDPCTNPTVVEQHDTIAITIAVNDAMMGTTVPAPGTYSYTEADTLWLSATPYAGYNFVNWTVEYYSDGVLQTTVVENQTPGYLVSGLVSLAPLTFTANFATDDTTGTGDMVTITVMAADSTMGYTTGSGVYSVDSLFVATAYPYTGYHFLQWQVYDGMGDYLGYVSSNPFMYYCDDNYIVVAYFEADPEPIDCLGTSCYLTISGTDSYGDGWNGGDLRLMQNDNLVGIFVVEDSMAVSTFEVCNDYPVNFVWNSGSWDGEVAFTVSSAAGTTILSVASASSLVDGNVFAMVTDPCTNPTVVEMHDTISITIAVNNATMGTTVPAPGTYSYTDADTLWLSAVPNTGYSFVNWTVEYYYEGVLQTTVVDNQTPGYLVSGLIPLAPLTFTANFAVSSQYTFNLTCDPAAGTVTGGGLYNEGDTVVFTATANADYIFMGWELYALDDSVVTYFTATDNPLTFIASEGTFGISNTMFDCYGLFEYMGGINCGGTSCYLTVSGTDSYGDGWNGGHLYLYQNDTVVGIFAVEDSMAVSTFEVCNDYPVNFVWNSGSWDGEVAFTVSSAAGTTILSVASASSLVDGNVFAMVTDPCTNPVVVEQHDTIAITIAVNDATLGTTVPAPGTYYYTEADTLWLSAVANTGNFFVDWTVDYFVDGVPFSQTFEDGDLGFLVSSLVNFAPMTFTANFSSSPVGEITDTVVCTYAVNNPAMGTTNPAPGTYTYYNGQQLHCIAVPNNGYQLVGWTMNVAQDGVSLLDTTVNIAVSDFFELFDGWTVEDGDNGLVWNIMANFAPSGAPVPIVPEDSVAITYAVNNANWGTTDPAPGTYYYGEGDVFSVSATAYENCSLVDWKMTVYYDGAFLYEVALGSPIPVLGDSISADMLGMAITITAIFEGPVSIDDVDADNVKVYSTEGRIVVLGVEDQTVSVYDVNGRVLDRKNNASERVEFNVANTGVYLVKVGNAAARRVVVVR